MLLQNEYWTHSSLLICAAKTKSKEYIINDDHKTFLKCLNFLACSGSFVLWSHFSLLIDSLPLVPMIVTPDTGTWDYNYCV